MNPRKIVKKLIPKNLFRFIEPYGHLVESILVNMLNGFPARKLKIIGVTGTNGKTTTAFMIHKLLVSSGYMAGLMSTVGYGVGDDIKPQIEHMTTVSAPVLVKRIKEMNNQGVEWLVLETTSHALAQNRVWGVPYSIAVFTNLTHEHLEYHRTFERYRSAKVKLFKFANKNLTGMRVGIVNADDPNSKYFSSAIANPISYGIEKGDLQAQDVKLTPDHLSYLVKYNDLKYDIFCHIPGKFNVYNSLATVAVGIKLGLSPEQISSGIKQLLAVEGRMTKVDLGQDFSVIVDYAHSPDSFEKLFKDIKPVVKNKLIVVFGSAGERDVEKRSIQGQLAGKFADIVILSEEDDRGEDGQDILKQISQGSIKEGKVLDQNLFLILDRNKAIDFALQTAQTGDTLLLLGKGHEKTIIRSDGVHPWNEIEITKKLLAKRLKV